MAVADRTGVRLLPLLLKALAFGIPAASVCLHVAISLIVPGDAGSLAALGSGAFFVLILLMVGVVGIIAFPIAAIASWPLRGLVWTDPILAALAAAGVGVGLGFVLTRAAFQIGPGDYWSGALVGCVFGLVWFAVVRTAIKGDEAKRAGVFD